MLRKQLTASYGESALTTAPSYILATTHFPLEKGVMIERTSEVVIEPALLLLENSLSHIENFRISYTLFYLLLPLSSFASKQFYYFKMIYMIIFN